MKRKIRIKDGKKVLVKEQEIRAKDHLEAQKKYPHIVQENKRKKKPKYKKKWEEELYIWENYM